MKNSLAVLVPLLLLSAGTADAQTISEGWASYRARQNTAADPATPPATGTSQVTTAAAQPAPAGPPSPATTALQWTSAPARRERPRGGFYVGAQGGSGWVYEDIDQRVIAVNAGYRWQAGDFAQVGIELGTGKLQETHWRGERVPDVRFSTVGANARFNFGNASAWFGIVRSGYWRAETEDWGGEITIDGAYAGLGVGVDVNRHFNLQLTYTAYLYSSDYYYGDGYQVNRADVLTAGAEVRF